MFDGDKKFQKCNANQAPILLGSAKFRQRGTSGDQRPTPSRASSESNPSLSFHLKISNRFNLTLSLQQLISKKQC